MRGRCLPSAPTRLSSTPERSSGPICITRDRDRLRRAVRRCVSIDAARRDAGGYDVRSDFGSRPTDRDGLPMPGRSEAETSAPARSVITSIEKDGSLEGYDNELNQLVSRGRERPRAGRVAAPATGSISSTASAIGGASAVCTTNIYHFTDTSIRSAKRFLDQPGIPIRTMTTPPDSSPSRGRRVRYCTRCLMPDTRPRIVFDADGRLQCLPERRCQATDRLERAARGIPTARRAVSIEATADGIASCRGAAARTARRSPGS